MEKLARAIWYENYPLGWILLPLEGIYRTLVMIRRYGYRYGWFAITQLPVPVIIVGNITVGGSGKTPLVLWIAQFLAANGWRPGIISRGHGGRIKSIPREVKPDDDPREVGDEPLLLARRTQMPIAVCRRRAKAGELLLAHHDCDCLIADDGLQHYGLARDVEIAVTDRARGLGNRHCLPVGPLRESMQRLDQIPLRVAQGCAEPGEYNMILILGDAVFISDDIVSRPLTSFCTTPVHAVAGIGHPEKFFAALRARGLTIIVHSFPDHYFFRPDELDFGDELPVLMTEKDAVKCAVAVNARHWYVPVEAHISPEFGVRLLELIKLRGYA
ncbi:Tetraacyldisaccharide 4'-kinase [Gammaproteobacteria bacterium]